MPVGHRMKHVADCERAQVEGGRMTLTLGLAGLLIVTINGTGASAAFQLGQRETPDERRARCQIDTVHREESREIGVLVYQRPIRLGKTYFGGACHGFQASEIVNRQEPPRGHYPAGAYVSSNRVTPDFFSKSDERHRKEQITTGMSFLHSLIHQKLTVGLKKPDTDHIEDDESNLPAERGPEASSESLMARDGSDPILDTVDDAAIMSLENLVFLNPTPAEQAAHKLDTIPIMICAMIANACNRRCNAIPLANGLMTLAGGVSCRVNEWLQAFSMTISRPSILKALDHLSCLQEKRMMELFKIGVNPKKYAEELLVAAGDVGSNQLLESLRVKRFPPVNGMEGLEWVLSVFGGAHTTWNFSKAIWSLHWGNADNGNDTGTWRSSFAIGGEYKKPEAAQSFNAIMRSMQMVHKANLLFIITSVYSRVMLNDVGTYLIGPGHGSQVIKSNKQLDLTKTSDVENLLDLVWSDYFDVSALEHARTECPLVGLRRVPRGEHFLVKAGLWQHGTWYRH
ncbi:uncharacterized protein MELLADRAFT_113091 [Melampsora larici-populina 98AG31]|uniref:DUF6589 domain-containing protein n=1 Tax=Melampsora larici-populina (strain 98AG31 / pathotype 3-4-7) TaxID=747676 RepID=F4S8P8_MELLP|nr:uncharacterized protein MELLADRAFT_113091 [Melampsora larici-populina 98AG31]EGF98933.1 hypothetical protein MELLADRAFT_113091 [Melampsora larici-populina 98AG31]